jgi:hypothetical protein
MSERRERRSNQTNPTLKGSHKLCMVLLGDRVRVTPIGSIYSHGLHLRNSIRLRCGEHGFLKSRTKSGGVSSCTCMKRFGCILQEACYAYSRRVGRVVLSVTHAAVVHSL